MKRPAPPLPAPIAVPLRQAPAVTGLSRSTIYRLAADGRLTLLKAGRTTLLCMVSARAYLDALPKVLPQPRGDA